MTPDRIDLMEFIAIAKNYALGLPATKAHRVELSRKIAYALQRKWGHFTVDQVYDVLSQTYAIKSIDVRIAAELEDWVKHDATVEALEDEMYRFRK